MPIIFRRAVRFSRTGRMRRPSGYSGPGRWRSGNRLFFRRRSGASILSGGGPNRIGPPLRSGVITGSARPVVPRASTSYPTLVPGARSNARELKYWDSSATGNIATGANYVVSLNDAIVPGTGLTLREGQNTRFMGLRVRMNFFATGASDVYTIPSVLIIYDKQPEALLPVISDMFDNDPLNLTVTSFSLPSFGTRDRYKILYWKSKVVAPLQTPLPSATQVVLSEQFRNMNFDLNCNLPVTYRSAGPGPASIGIGNVYIVLLNYGLHSTGFSHYCRYLFADVD